MENFQRYDMALEMTFANVQPMMLYRNKQYIPLPRGEKPGYGNAIFFLTPSTEGTMKILTTDYLHWFIDMYRLYTRDTIFREKIGRKVVMKNMTSATKKEWEKYQFPHTLQLVLPTQRPTKLKAGKNLIVDLGEWCDLYFQYSFRTSIPVIVRNFIRFVANKINDPAYANYKKKIVYIPMDQWLRERNIHLGYTKDLLDNPLAIFLFASYKYPAIFNELPDVTIILGDPTTKEFLVIEKNMFTKENYSKIRNKIKTMQSVKFKDETEKILQQEFTKEEEDENSDINNEPGGVVSNGVVHYNENPDRKRIIPEITDDMSDEEKDRIHKMQRNRAIIINAAKRNLLGEMDDLTADPEIYDPSEMEDDDSNIDIGDTFNDDVNDVIDDVIAETLEDDPDALLDPNSVSQDRILDEVNRRVLRPTYMPKRSPEEERRVKELQDLQSKVLKEAQTLDDVKSKTIEVNDISDAVDTTNPKNTIIKYPNVDRNYVDKKLESDIDNAVAAMAGADVKVFIVSKTVEDTSDQLNLKMTYTYELEDEHGGKHTIKFDIPKVIDGNYIYVNGSRRILEHQLFLIPIVKLKPDSVQVITLYNKLTISRIGINDVRAENIKKYMILNRERFKIIPGSAYAKNRDRNYRSSLDIDNYSRQFVSFSIGKKNFYLDREKMHEIAKKHGMLEAVQKEEENDRIPVGYDSYKKEIIYTDGIFNLTDLIMRSLSTDDTDAISKMKPAKQKIMRSEIEIMSKSLPLALLLFFFEGFSSVMNKAGINYHVLDKNDGSEVIDRSKWGVIESEDKYILWERDPIWNSLLMNGLQNISFTNFRYEDFENREAFIDIIGGYYSSRNMAFTLQHYYDFMIDPISKEILQDYGYPTDLVSLLLVANKMLCDNSFTPINNSKVQRIRSSEIIVQSVYTACADAYSEFRKTQHKKKPTRITMKQNAVMNAINSGSSLTNDASVLNPILELEKSRSVTPRGPRGVGKERAMTLDKRAYDPTMVGILGVTTPNDSKVGVTRQMTLEPNITSTRGYVEVTDPKDYDDLSNTNVLTPAELLSPPGVMHDDGPRTAMAYKQTQYMLPIAGMEPVYFGNKVESVVPYYLSRSFVVVAKDDGEVVEIKDGIIIVQYKDGTYDSVDTNMHVKKNSSSGFYINVQMESPLKKVGDTFKKNEVIGYDKAQFTKNENDLSVSMNIGTPVKVAILPNYDIYEDSAPITKKMSDKFSTVMTMDKTIALDANSYVESMKDIGDEVNVGDELIVFDQAHEDSDVAKYLEDLRKRLGDELHDMIMINSMSTIKTKYAGKITDIKVYSTVPVEELSESLQKIVKKYTKKSDDINKLLEKYRNPGDMNYYKCGQVITETSDPLEPDYQGRIRNHKIGNDGKGVLIIFYISFTDLAKIGDKGSAYTALKFIISHIVDEGLEAYSEYRPNEEISTIIAPSAILARKTPSIELTMFANKCIIELKRHLEDIYFEKN